MSDRPVEYCSVCEDPTGKAGAGEDSIFWLDGAIGPLCDECDDQLREEVLDNIGLTPDFARVVRDLLWFVENPYLHPRDDWLLNQIRAAARNVLTQTGMKPRTKNDGPFSSEYHDEESDG